MFYRFRKGKQRALIREAIDKAGSERKLAKHTKIPKGSIYALKSEKRNLSEDYADKLCRYLKIKLKDMGYVEELPDNWGRKKGGRKLIEKKILEGSLKKTIEKLKKASSERMCKWHKDMKEKHPKEYYVWQYERFKKIGRGYSFLLDNGIKVRNSLERKVGNFLVKNFPEFEYELYLNINGRAYFPDFVYKNLIIEVTGWKHPRKEKIQRLIKKSKDYLEKGYVLCFFIPRVYRKFYKELRSPIVSTLEELKEFINASVA